MTLPAFWWLLVDEYVYGGILKEEKSMKLTSELTQVGVQTCNMLMYLCDCLWY
jgi:hypothetical protein